MLKNTFNTFRIVAFLEGCSYILLGITMPLKYKMAMPKPNYIVGSAHGFLFISYVVLLAIVAYQYKWSIKKIALAFLVSLIPFGTFYAEKKIYNQPV